MDNVVNMQGERVVPNQAANPETPLIFQLVRKPEPEVKKEEPRKPPSVFKKIKWKFYKAKRFIWETLIRPVRDFFYRLYGDRLLSELILLGRKLNRKDFHVFVHISGHTNTFDVSVHMGGWTKENGNKVSLSHTYMPGHSTLSKMRPKDIKELMKVLRSLSKLNHLYPNNEKNKD